MAPTLLKMFSLVSVLLVSTSRTGNASYYHANVKEGAECFLFDVRFPFMPSGTYFSFWNGGFYPVGGSFYGGVFSRGPGKHGGEENQRHGTPWTYWGSEAYSGDRPRPVYIGEYTVANAAGGEGSVAAVGGAKPFLRKGVWFTMCKRVWEPAEKNADYRYEGWWIKDNESGVWHLSAVMRIPAPVTGYRGWSTFVEEIAKGADRVIDMRGFYCRLKGEWHSVDTFSMDNKYQARFTLLENDTVIHYEDPVEHDAGTKGKTSWTVKQPARPSFEEPLVDNLKAGALESQVSVQWEIPETSNPQLGYHIEVLGAGGHVVAEHREMMPHIRIKIINTAGKKAERVRLTVTDVFDQTVTREISLSDGKASKAVAAKGEVRAGLGYELFKLDEQDTLESIPDLAALRSTDGWEENAKAGYMRSGILPRLEMPPREMWDRKRSQFAVRYAGNLNVPKTGFYVFELAAGGNSQLRIDGKVIGDNGFLGNPSARRYLTSLEAGVHAFELRYAKRAWENNDGFCSLRWEGPDMPLRSFTQSDFSVLDDGDVPVLKAACKPVGGPSNLVDIAVEVETRGQAVSRIDVFCGELILGQLTEAPYALRNQVLPAGDFDICARVVYDEGRRTVDSNWIPYASGGAIEVEGWTQKLIGVQGAGLGVVKNDDAGKLDLRVTGDSHWFLSQEVEGDFSVTGRVVDFSRRTWRDPVYGYVKSRSWLGLMFALKGGGEPCFYNSYGFYRLAGEGWRGTPCHGDLGGSRRTDYQYPEEAGDWIRLERNGMLFSTLRSKDGKTWELARYGLISPRSHHAWRKGAVGVTFRQQASNPGGGWAQGHLDQLELESGTPTHSVAHLPVEAEDARLFKGRVLSVVQAPSEPNRWYARCYGGTILKSTDRGVHWAPVAGAPTVKGADSFVRSIAVHPKNPEVLLAGVGKVENGKALGGLYRSEDGGATWKLVCDAIDFDGQGPSVFLGEVLSFNPMNPDQVAAGGESLGLFQSLDGGKTWQHVAVEKPLKLKAHRIASLHYNSLMDGHLTVATFPDSEFGASGLGEPGLKLPEQIGGGLYSVGEKNIYWGMDPYEGFGFTSAHMHQANGNRGVGYFMSSRGALKWHRSGIMHSWPNIPQNGFYTALGGVSDGKEKVMAVCAPFSSEDLNPIAVFGRGKLARNTTSPVPLAAGISGLTADQADPSRTLIVCNRHGILRTTDRGITFELVYPMGN